MLKILQINTEKTWRGGERQTLYLCEGLTRANIHVTLLARKDTPLFNKASEKGIQTIGVKNSFDAIRFILKHHRSFDIIHSQTGKGVTLALPAKIFGSSTPLFYTRRVDFLPTGLLTRYKYKKIDQLVGISDAICKILSQAGFKNVLKITSVVVPRELDTTRANDFFSSLGIQDRHIIGSVAALVPHKDPTTLVFTAKKLLTFRKDFAFVLFGDGPLKEEIQKLITELGLEKYFFLAGFQDNVEDFYSRFSVFILTSIEEGLGSSVLDAFYYGVPVVATSAGGLTELVTGRGELCPVKDADCLAQKIHLLLENSDIRDEYIQKAKMYVRTQHDLNQVVEQYIRLYKKFTENL
jgi:glycosyltransferase involved in cell wall biosynthesis